MLTFTVKRKIYFCHTIGILLVFHLIVHVRDVHLLKDQLGSVLVLLGHLANGHVGNINRANVPEKKIFADQWRRAVLADSYKKNHCIAKLVEPGILWSRSQTKYRLTEKKDKNCYLYPTSYRSLARLEFPQPICKILSLRKRVKKMR